MLARIRRWILFLILLSVAGFLLFKFYHFRLALNQLPSGTTIGGVDVSGMSLEEAADLVQDRYYQPLYLYHREEHVELDPRNVGFSLDMTAMTNILQQQLNQREEWKSFASFIFERPLDPLAVPLVATHDEEALRSTVESIADFLDEPARAAQMLAQEEGVEEGRPGYLTDQEASIAQIEAALYRLDSRQVQMKVVEEQVPEMNLSLLGDVIERKLQTFDGLGSIFIMDLQNGEELAINADVAMSGLSILKIAIFVEAYRALDSAPTPEQEQLFMDTATRSSNFGANLLLHIVAGEDNTYKGADIMTESMRKLGLVNTFMAVPYDASPPAYRQTTYTTPANSRDDIDLLPDTTMQSTAEEIGTLLAMIYYCSKGGGTLLAVYPDEITPAECQAIIDLMILNEEGNLIRFGVPSGTPVSHKHGWALGTHADAGIVFSLGGDYVIVEYLNQPGEWLVADESFPILREIARATYNYFNMDQPYLVSAMNARLEIDEVNPFSENIEGQDDSAEIELPEESVENIESYP